MKINKTLTALVAGASLGMSGQAFSANGTSSGTTITNQATLAYKVGTVDQTSITGDASFIVATRVDFTLSTSESSVVSVTPNSTGYALEFSLTNTGNSAFDFSLSAAQLTGTDFTVGTLFTDDSDVTNVKVYADTNDSGSYESSTDLEITYLDEVAADDTSPVTFFVVSNTAATLIDGNIAGLNLTATAKTGGTASTEGATIIATPLGTDFDASVVQIVVANSTSTLAGGYQVSSAKFTTDNTGTTSGIGLTVNVINDTMCDTDLVANTTKVDYSTGTPNCPDADASYKPKAIPGAMVEYTLTAYNDGSVAAAGVKFTQNLLSTHVDAIDLQTGSLNNVTISHFDASATTTNDLTGTGVDISTTDLLSINFDTIDIEVSDLVTITFTAIAE